MKCRLIDSGKCSASMNMAIDEILLRNCTLPTLRFYGWSNKSVTIGYNQSAGSEINISACNKEKIPVVRRITGGKAVLHDRELTYAFVVPEKLGIIAPDVVGSYRQIAAALIFGLRKTGIRASMQKQPDRNKHSSCFASSNWYELIASGKKISGSAQRRVDGIVLQHGSILLECDYGLNALVFSRNGQKKAVGKFREKITSIKDELGKKVSSKLLKKRIKSGFEEALSLEFFEEALTRKEREAAIELAKTKYIDQCRT